MMKSLTITIIFVTTVLSCLSQDLTGKWYMVNRSGLIEMAISKDIIKSRKLFTDFTPKDERVESNQLLKTVQLKDRILLITRAKKDSTKYSAVTVINFSDKKYFQLAWNGLDTITSSMEALIEINSNDHRQLFGYYVFSAQYTDTLKKMTAIENMTLNDFKSYARVYVTKFKQTSKEFEKYNIGYMAPATYNFQLITQSLFDIGFNPLQNTMTVEEVYKKYSDDPGVKTIMSEMQEK